MKKGVGLTPVIRFFNLLKVDKQEVFSIYIYALFNGIVSLSLPLGIQAIINLISAGQVSTSWIILVAFVVAGIAFRGVLQIMQLAVSENLQQKIFTRSAFEFAYRIPRMKVESLDKTYIPELVNRFFDTLSVQKGLSKILIDFSSASIQVVFGLILLSLYHPFFILFSMVLVVIVYLIFRFTAPAGLKTSLTESHFKYEVAHWLEEVARAMETFKLAGNSPLPMQKTDKLVGGYINSRKAHFKTLVVQYINLVAFKVIIASGLLIIGGLLVINQQMNIGQFVASEIIIILVLASVEKLILSMETIYDVLTAIEKIGKITDIPLERDSGTKGSGRNEGLALNMVDLTYKFDDAQTNTIDELSLNIAAGETICISGFDGSGKSLLLHIMAGLYDKYTGQVAYNSKPLGSWCKDDLRSLIGNSLTRDDIFGGTLLENITLGRPGVEIDEVDKLVAIVGLGPFIESQQLGYETELIPEGKNLPYSVRLRIILARCLAGQPQLILLDSTFNQLNEPDRGRFLDYLLGEDKVWTVVAISNDAETAARFNRTLVLQKGKILADGALNSFTNQHWYNTVFQP